MNNAIVCLPRMLPRNLWISAARTATQINPVNHPPIDRLALVMPGFRAKPEHLAVMKRAGVLVSEKRGKEVYYRPDRLRIARYLETLSNMLKKCCE